MKYILPKSSRFFSVFLAILLVLSSINIGALPVKADTSTVISIENTSVAPDGTTVVTVKALGVKSPGLAGYDFKIHYDPNVVEVEAVSGTLDFPAPTTDFGSTSEVPGNISAVAAFVEVDPDTQLPIEKIGDLNLFTLTFKALSSTPQVTPITLTVNDFSDSNLLDIRPTISNGSITIGNSTTPSLSVSPDKLSESAANDGSLSSSDITLTLANGVFASDIAKSDITIADLPQGMDYTVERTSDTTLKVSITGNAVNHNLSNSTTLTLTVAQGKVPGAAADLTGTIGLEFLANNDNVQTPPLLPSQVSVANNLDDDIITFSSLQTGDIVKAYRDATTTSALGIAAVSPGNTSVAITIPQLGTTAGIVYVSITSPGMSESSRTPVNYAEEPKQAVSTAPTLEQITVVNNPVGTNDTVTVKDLHGGDTVNVYVDVISQTLLGSGTLPTTQTTGVETVSIPQLGTTAGTVYVSVTSPGMSESSRTAVIYPAEAISNPLNVVIGNVTGRIGQNVTVNIDLKNVSDNTNLGIVASMLTVNYDETVLQLVSTTVGSGVPANAVFTANPTNDEITAGANPGQIVFLESDETQENNLIKTDGTYATLVFKVKDTATEGKYPITFSAVAADNSFTKMTNNLDNPVEDINGFVLVPGSVTVVKWSYGDLNGAGGITSTDYALMKSFLLKKISQFPNGVPLQAADLNGSGGITSTDYALLKSFLLKKISKFPVEK